MPKINELAERIRQHYQLVYPVGKVTRKMVEDILDFNILLEPPPNARRGDAEFANNQQQWAGIIKMGDTLIRMYGVQLNSDVIGMQYEFYSFTNSEKYLESPMTISVARTVLNSNWDGINGWKE